MDWLLTSRLRVFGPNSRHTLRAALNFARILNALGRGKEAELLLMERIYAPSIVASVPTMYLSIADSHLATSLAAQGRMSEASEVLRKIVADETERDDANIRLSAMSQLAHLLAKQNDLAEADRLQRIALAGLEHGLGSNDPKTLSAIFRLSELARAKSDLAEADRVSRRLIESARQTMPPNHPSLAGYLIERAKVLSDMRRLSEAEIALRESWDVLRGVKVDPALVQDLELTVVELDRRWNALLPGRIVADSDRTWREDLTSALRFPKPPS